VNRSGSRLEVWGLGNVNPKPEEVFDGFSKVRISEGRQVPVNVVKYQSRSFRWMVWGGCAGIPGVVKKLCLNRSRSKAPSYIGVSRSDMDYPIIVVLWLPRRARI